MSAKIDMRDVLKRLNEMKEIDPKPLKNVTKKAANIILQSARRKCISSHVRKSLDFITKNDGKFPTTTLIGLTNTKQNSSAKITVHAHASILEYGAGERMPRKRKSKAVLIDGKWATMSQSNPFKAIPPRPFWRPAIDENQQKVKESMINGLTDIIDKQANNLNLK
jgi:hypothetical protein